MSVCDIRQNVAGGQGGGVSGDSLVVVGTLIVLNGAATGGGVAGAGDVERCTIADNGASVHGGGLYLVSTEISTGVAVVSSLGVKLLKNDIVYSIRPGSLVVMTPG